MKSLFQRWKRIFFCLTFFLGLVAGEKSLQFRNNIYDKYGSKKKLIQLQTLLRPFLPLLRIYLTASRRLVGIFPTRVQTSVPLHWKCRALTAGPPGKFFSPYLSFASQLPNSVFRKWRRQSISEASEHLFKFRFPSNLLHLPNLEVKWESFPL